MNDDKELAFPLETLETLLAESINPNTLREQYGLPHPLWKFAKNGIVEDNNSADVILEFLNHWNFEEPGTEIHQASEWFLFNSKQAFFLCCEECGIDAERLRDHLQLFR